MKSKRLVALAAVLVVALGAPTVARADAVTDWNVIATNAILAPPAPSAHASTLSFAMVQGAVYDAVNAIDGGHRRYLVRPAANPWDSKDAAAATAAFRVLSALLPAQVPTLQPLYDSALAAIPPGPMKNGGIAAGEAAAAAMLAVRANDGRGGPFTFVIGDQPGNWRPLTPTALDPAAWVGNVRPFVIETPWQFRSQGPNALTSRKYAREFAEVKRVGSLTSTTRTADQTRAAIFWQAQPLALYGGALRQLSARRGLDIADNARLFAMVSLAAADGAISCWNDKYQRNFWRPLAAIREAATDGNPATVADPQWKPLFDPSTVTVPPGSLVTPAFPEHPSGHGCVSGAVLHAAQAFFGTDRLSFDIVSSRFPGQPRHYERFSEAIEEVIDARVWGGIHFRTADEQGATIGKQVARWLVKYYFQPVR
jgi:PAP2 superfamily